MTTGKELVIRRTGAGLFHAREFSTALAPSDAAGIRSHTLLWASQDMSQADLAGALAQRGWAQEDIAKQLKLAGGAPEA